MATKNRPSTCSAPENSPQREEFADFALVLKDGRELKCHKVKLAEVSPFFCAMLRQDCVETQTNKMQVSEFEPETVQSFLDWIYADMELEQAYGVYIRYKKTYDLKILTPDLLRLSHLYQVKNLEDECVQHFLSRRYLRDDNAAEICEIWTLAEIIGHDDLKRAVLQYFGNKRDKLLEFPGMKECFKNPQLMESLVTYISDREKVFTVKVQCWGDRDDEEPLTTQEVRVKLSDTIKDLRLRINNSLEKWTHARRAYRCQRKTIGHDDTNPPWDIGSEFPLRVFSEHCTLDEVGYMNHIDFTNGCVFECIILEYDNQWYDLSSDDDGQENGG